MKTLNNFSKNYLLLILISLPVLFNLFCSNNLKPEAVTKVIFSIGDTELQRSGNQPVMLKVTDVISVGDIIKTGEKASVVLQIEDKDIIKIQENSEVKITDLFTTGAAKIFVKEGQVLAKVTRLKKSETFDIAMPTAVASVRGTEFSVSYRSGKGYVSVREGKVAVGTKKLDAAAIEKEMNATKNNLKLSDIKESIKDETLIEKGNTAVIEQKEELKDKTAISGKEAPKIEVRLLQMTQMEDLTLQKISAIQIIPELEKKSAEEIIQIQKPSVEKVEQIEEEIKKIEVKTPENTTIKDLQKKYGLLSVVQTKDGKEFTGVFKQKENTIEVITTTGTIVINPADIKKISKYK